jgi:parallel beta-helix repeat protein
MATGPGLVIEGNDLGHNRGMGLLCVGCDGARIAGNTIHDNRGGGVAYLKSRAGRVENNRLWRNGWDATPVEAAIFVTSSRDTEVARNTLAFHPLGIVVAASASTSRQGADLCDLVTANLVTDNVIIDAARDRVALRPHDARRPCASNTSARNWYSTAQAGPPGDEPGLLPLGHADRARLLALAGIADR